MNITTEIFNLYNRNLPEILRNEKQVKRIISDKNNHIITRRDGDNLIGVSVVNKNTIYLLIVDKPYQRRKIGTELLAESEKHITAQGFDKIITGIGNDYIMPGVPMNDGAHDFFIKHGYIHSWGDDSGCFDMGQDLRNFNHCVHAIGDTINGITYRWAVISDLNNIIKCVTDADDVFIDYYNERELYENDSDTRVLVAETDGEIAGVLMVALETEGKVKGMGSVACTATVHKHRNKGIATTMVQLGTKHLKELGLDRAYLEYTYTDIVNMYGKAGYKVTMQYFMGEKSI
jgi:ribosomal protein S18 acetylase RimI-like enzyme